jgi:NAD(P)-dependent dehydrogenase (short-subunit alcohol dehydrogenase family)
MRLQDKVVVVTGGGGGMGRVAAELFAREGARVAVCDVSAQGGEETVRRVAGAGGDAFFVQAFCCKHAIPHMIRSGGGSIINIASFVALLGCTVPQDVYTMSKGGLIALTKSLAVQFAKQGIRANAICPGPIETPMLRQLWTSEEARNLRLNRIPLGRFGAAEDIVYLGLYLASDESSWTTGSVMVVDGGITSNYF